MPSPRKVVLANDQYYHIFNRGVERRTIFESKRDYSRALETIKYYRFANLPLRFSKIMLLEKETREKMLDEIKKHKRQVEIIAFCLMPNHFHFLLRQLTENGISKFLSDFQNSYTKYFNTKNKRVGPLLQGMFKAVLVETDEQLIHLTRYIHLNPVTSYIMEPEDLDNYPWSSFPEYLNPSLEGICEKELAMSLFPSIVEYKKFVLDQVEYARELDKIKHLTLE